MRRLHFALLTALTLTLAGCDFPKDADGTLDRARADGMIRAGFVLLHPGQTEPEGRDAEVVAAWAEREGLDIEWQGGAETDLVASLESREMAIVVGRIAPDAEWTASVGFTLPVPPGSRGEEDVIVLTSPGENALTYSLDRFIGSLPEPAP